MEKNNKINVIVLGLGASGLTIARALGKENIKVYGIALSKFEVGTYSKYVKRISTYDPRINSNELLNFLIKFKKKNNNNEKLVLFPSGDEFVKFIAENINALKEHFYLNKNSNNITDIFLDKKNFNQFCVENSIDCIKSYFPCSIYDAIDYGKSLNFPCFIKPIYQLLWAPNFGVKKGFLCENYADYKDNINKVKFCIDNVIIQEVVEGPETNIFLCKMYRNRKGEFSQIFVIRKIRQYPYKFGTATCIEYVENQHLSDKAKEIVLKSNLYGFAEVEFKWCQKDNLYKVVEVNIRGSRTYGIVEALGENLIYYAYMDVQDKLSEISFNKIMFKKIKWFFIRDLFSIFQIIKSGDQKITNIIKTYIGKKTFCIFSINDIIPFFMYFFEIGAKLIKSKR